MCQQQKLDRTLPTFMMLSILAWTLVIGTAIIALSMGWFDTDNSSTNTDTIAVTVVTHTPDPTTPPTAARPYETGAFYIPIVPAPNSATGYICITA